VEWLKRKSPGISSKMERQTGLRFSLSMRKVSKNPLYLVFLYTHGDAIGLDNYFIYFLFFLNPPHEIIGVATPSVLSTLAILVSIEQGFSPFLVTEFSQPPQILTGFDIRSSFSFEILCYVFRLDRFL